MKKVEEVIGKLNFELLRKQKEELVAYTHYNRTSMSVKRVSAIDGIINMIDSIQDAVVEDGIKTEAEVFGEEK
jgi:hypothetical protein